jgi:hypothetical protein
LARLISTITIDIIELTSFASRLQGRGDRTDSEEGETGDKEGGASDISGLQILKYTSAGPLDEKR